MIKEIRRVCGITEMRPASWAANLSPTGSRWTCPMPRQLRTRLNYSNW